MIPVINDIDRLLQAAPSRYGQAYERRIALSASARAFSVGLDAAITPASIVFIASRVGFSGGTVEFSTDTGIPLTVDGDVATLVGSDLKASGCEITATITYQGERHEAKQSIAKVLGFDSSTPPAPANLHTAGTLASIQLSWDPTNNPNIGEVEIWRALTNDLAAASAVGSTSGLARSYVDAIGAGGSFYYWIRYVSKANIVGPFNAPAGTLGTAGTDAVYLLSLLQGEITESQLHQDLGQKIDLITASAQTVGSVANRIAAEAAARAEALAEEAAARGSGIASEASSRQEADAVISSRIDAVISSVEGAVAAITSEQTTRASADGALSNRIDAVVSTAGGNTAAILAEQNARANADGALSSRIDTIVASAGGANAAVIEEREARVSADEALSSRIDTVVASAAGNTAAINSEATTRANADSSLASAIDTLVASVGANAAAIQSEATTRANQTSANATQIANVQAVVSDPTTGLVTKYAAVKTTAEAAVSAVDGVKAKYSVQVETDGVVGGIELLGGGSKVDFGVRGNTFFVAAPKGSGIPNQVPFVVRTTWTEVNGYWYAPGVYMDSVFVYNLSGDRIQAKSIKANKIDVGEISAISGNLGTMTAARIQSAASGQRVVTTQLGTVMLDQFNNRKVLLGDDSLWG